MTWEGLSESLNALSQDSFHSVQKINDGGPEGVLYRPQVAELMTHLRRQVVESIIEKRFKPRGRRLFRLLMDRPLLESKTVWDLSMIPKKDANETLCSMLRAQLVSLQEVPRSADHNPQRTFFLWHVEWPKVLAHVGGELLKGMEQLLRRRAEKVRECDEYIGAGGEVADLSAAQLAHYKTLQNQVERLDQAMLRLDETLLLMCS